MKRMLGILLAATLSLAMSPTLSRVPDGYTDMGMEEARAAATRSGKNILIYVSYGGWCSQCAYLESTIAADPLKKIYGEKFHFVHAPLRGDQKIVGVRAYLKEVGVTVAGYAPQLIFLDPRGVPLCIASGGYNQAHRDGLWLGEFTAKLTYDEALKVGGDWPRNCFRMGWDPAR